MSKRVVILVLLVVLFGAAVFAYIAYMTRQTPEPTIPKQSVVVKSGPRHEIIGYSVEGRSIEAYTFTPPASKTAPARGNASSTRLLLVGGMHGGYEWNSVVLAYKMIDYLTAHPEEIPTNEKITVIPALNPDGVYKVIGKEGRFSEADVPTDEGPVGTGRFNAHDVDINRNFDCKWQPKSTWRGNTVSAGTAPFSEPEAAAFRDFVFKEKPTAVVFWHSQSNAVYASECEDGIIPETRAIMNAYAQATGYKAVDVFDAYTVTGDSEGWLASIEIPAITVELSTHDTIEWDKNLAGVKALFDYYSDLI